MTTTTHTLTLDDTQLADLCDWAVDEWSGLPPEMRKALHSMLAEHDSRLGIPWGDLADVVSEAVEAAADEWTGCWWTTCADPTEGFDGDGCSAQDVRDACHWLDTWLEEWRIEEATPPDHLTSIVEEIGRLAYRRREDGDEARCDYRSAIESARRVADYLDDVESSAASAGEYGRECVAHLHRGDIAEAVSAIESASHAESEYGDDPTWSGPRKLVEQIAEAVEELDLDRLSAIVEGRK